MLQVKIENIGDVAIVACGGRIVWSDAAFQLREAVTTQTGARTVVVELSEVSAIEGDGLGMIFFLRRWAQDLGIRFKVFSPSTSVRDRLKKAGSMSEFDVPSLHELMGQLIQVECPETLAA